MHRWPGGVDFQDHALDVLIAADRSWSWKDEGEFAAQTGGPLFWDADGAAQIRAEGERLSALAEHGMFPFDGAWCDFQPDPAWQPTALPHWWDTRSHAVIVSRHAYSPSSNEQPGTKSWADRQE